MSKELFYAMTKVDQSKEVYYTPASARATRFQRRPARPLKTIGWCGVPGCEKKFGGVDAKQFGVFEEIVKVSGLTPLVSYQNYTYDTMQDFYDALDLLVCTSSTEGGPLGIFEAVACGVPVISTNVGLVKELNFIKTFETIEEANELIEQLKDDTFRSEYTMHQYSQFIANWSMEQLVPHWEAFFNGCAKIHPGRVLQF